MTVEDVEGRHEQTAAQLELLLTERADRDGPGREPLIPCERVYLNGVEVDLLERLFETGLYGDNLAQVIVRLLDQALLESSVRGLLSRPETDLEELRP